MPDQSATLDAAQIVRLLNLAPLPLEGGFYCETYRSEQSFAPGAPFVGLRARSTAIYYLLTADTFSAVHRLPGDETFHFYLGDPVVMLMLRPDGVGETVRLGPDLERMKVQHTVPANTWQATRLLPGGAWALLGTTMSPGFEFGDYEAGTDALAEEYPEWAEDIRSLMV